MNKKLIQKNPIVNKSFSFAIMVVQLADELYFDNRKNISNQLLKSGTSIGANIREAQNAESKNDFIHKMKIAAKEIDETEYWLELIEKSYEKYDLKKMISELEEVAKIVNAIIATSKRRVV